MFDLTKQDSFENIKDYWIPKIRECVDESMTFFLIGNKMDLKQEFEVNLKEVQIFVSELKINFITASAKTNENIDEFLK